MPGPKNQFSKDRATEGGKGDLHRGLLDIYCNSEYFGRSVCCKAPIVQIHGKGICEKCGEYCLKTKGK